MLSSLLDILICPFCRGSRLRLLRTVLKEDEIQTGEILCEDCRRKYPIIEGIPCLLNKEQLKAHKGTMLQEWLQRMEEVGKNIIDEDQKTYKDACKVAIGKEEIEEDTERLLWEKKLYKDNQTLRKELGGKFEAKWAIARENIRVRNDHVFSFIEESKGDFSGKRVLNVGPGTDEDLLERLESKGAEVINCDIILEPLTEMISHGRRESVCSDLKSLPFDSECFDAVFCFHVVHHIDPIEQALSEAVRVLKPKGKIFIVELNYYHLLSFFGRIIPNVVKKRLRKMVRRLTKTKERIFKPSPYEKVVKSRSLTGAIKRAGCIKVIRKTVTHAPIIFPDSIIKVWNGIAFRLSLIFDPIALEYLFVGEK